ncbi:MAG: ubiquinone/menaquinone biosynthesis methyltransferase [Fidelibacterota bacterium]|nr:MAG: ubiquinone/menaquinone biosynthesis methyltransferase [Candidatus Neomarinimicrobiota bacterium]
MTRFIHHGDDKRRFIRRMFAEIAPRYDLLNRLLTLGMDRHWRKRLAKAVRLESGERILDLACGTGDVARTIARQQPESIIVGADPVPEMLAWTSTRSLRLRTVCCESEALPFQDNSFRTITVAFGVRNFSYLDRSLQEINRILAPDGCLGILEFALPTKGRLRRFYHWYLTSLLPRLGALLSRGYAYHYLAESIRHFPGPEDFINLLASSGFSHVVTERFLGGTVWLYRGQKVSA